MICSIIMPLGTKIKYTMPESLALRFDDAGNLISINDRKKCNYTKEELANIIFALVTEKLK